MLPINQRFGVLEEHVLPDSDQAKKNTKLGASSAMACVIEGSKLRFWLGFTTKYVWYRTEALDHAVFDLVAGLQLGDCLISMDVLMVEADVINSMMF